MTDEDEDEAEDENEGELEEEDEPDAGRGKRNVQLPGHAPAPSRPVEDNELDGGDDKPLCKYGSKCFRFVKHPVFYLICYSSFLCLDCCRE